MPLPLLPLLLLFAVCVAYDPVLTGTAASAAVLKAGLTTKLLLSASLQVSTSSLGQVTMHSVAETQQAAAHSSVVTLLLLLLQIQLCSQPQKTCIQHILENLPR